jgi:hypothetical protein
MSSISTSRVEFKTSNRSLSSFIKSTSKERIMSLHKEKNKFSQEFNKLKMMWTGKMNQNSVELEPQIHMELTQIHR